MSSGQEVELKLRVADFDALKAVAKCAGADLDTQVPAAQTNHFFDAKDLRLRKERFAIRLRQEDGTFILTIKGAHPDATLGSALAIRVEEEDVVNEGVAQEILAGTTAPLDAFRALANARGDETGVRQLALCKVLTGHLRGSALVHLGHFTNQRWRVPFDILGHTLELELDRTTFPGAVIQHEVELEIPAGVDVDEAEGRLLSLFDQAGVEGSSAPGKATRFFAALNGLPIP